MKNIFTKSIACLAMLFAASLVWAQDIIVTIDAQRIDAKILEVSRTEIKYKEIDNLEGPTFILETTEINSIIYASGKVVLYNQSPTTPAPSNSVASPQPAQTLDESVEVTNNDSIIQNDYSVARVENFSGVYVFTDCTPIAQYEVLGEVHFDEEGAQHVSVMPTYGVSSRGNLQVTGSQVISYSETPQYNEIRNGLVSMSVMANRQVEGIIISIQGEGEGRATLIKFTEGAEDKSLARVVPHMGVFVFTDCLPVNTYSFVGNIPKAGGLDSNYNVIRDKLIQKAQKKFPTLQGVIIHLVTEGNDSAEVIRF